MHIFELNVFMRMDNQLQIKKLKPNYTKCTNQLFSCMKHLY